MPAKPKPSKARKPASTQWAGDYIQCQKYGGWRVSRVLDQIMLTQKHERIFLTVAGAKKLIRELSKAIPSP